MGVHSEAQMNRKFVEMAKLLNVYLNHWPKHEKYALASRVRNTAYQLYDYITEAQKRYHKKTTLSNLDIAHEQLRMQLYLANELERGEVAVSSVSTACTNIAGRFATDAWKAPCPCWAMPGGRSLCVTCST